MALSPLSLVSIIHPTVKLFGPNLLREFIENLNNPDISFVFVFFQKMQRESIHLFDTFLAMIYFEKYLCPSTDHYLTVVEGSECPSDPRWMDGWMDDRSLGSGITRTLPCF